MSLDGQGIRKLPAELGVPDVELVFQVISLEDQLTRRHTHFFIPGWLATELGVPY